MEKIISLGLGFIFKGDTFRLTKEINKQSIDLLLTDVPYGISFKSNMRKKKHKEIANDDNLDWLEGWLNSVSDCLKKEAHAYIFFPQQKVDFFIEKIRKSKLCLKSILIWDKNKGGMGDLEGDYSPSYEMIAFCSNGVKPLNGKRDSNIIRVTGTNNELHPTQKPLELMRYLIFKSTQEGDIVLDCFGGSGTTAVAAENLNRRWIIHEIEEDYVNTIQSRIEIELEKKNQKTLFG